MEFVMFTTTVVDLILRRHFLRDQIALKPGG